MERTRFPLRHARRAHRALLTLVFCAAILIHPSAASGSCGGVRRVETEEKWIALTFDDGPHPTHTPEILDLLSEYGIHATFFVVGSNVELCPEITRRTLDEGHELGNHTYSHANLTRKTERQREDEIERTEVVLDELYSYETTLLRPPGGCINPTVTKNLASLGCTVVLWSVDPRDWAHTKTDKIVENVRCNVRPGDILLFHDYISGETHTVEALRILIPELLRDGYRFVTVSELLAAD